MLSAAISAAKRGIPSPACLATVATRLAHTLPDLPYDYNALEPYISADIMKLHHQKHHNAYVTNLNIATEKMAEAAAKGDIHSVIALQPAVRFNGGGHINHSIFWEVLSPNGGDEPIGDLLASIKRDFGSYESMKKELSQAAVGVQGSGWAWLGFNPVNGRLKVVACPNQDPLQATTGLVPLFGIDVWEHAYYLQYKNVRADYIGAIFHVANWHKVEEKLSDAKLLAA